MFDVKPPPSKFQPTCVSEPELLSTAAALRSGTLDCCCYAHITVNRRVIWISVGLKTGEPVTGLSVCQVTDITVFPCLHKHTDQTECDLVGGPR